MKEDLTIWTVYHRDEQIEQYGLKETDIRKLYATHKPCPWSEREFNALNPAWSELVAMLTIWFNHERSEWIGINHYRRQFEPDVLPKVGECCCYAQYDLHDTILDHYGKCHHREDLEVAMNIIDKRCGEGNRFCEYLKTSTTLLGNMCFVMRWEDFYKMCFFVFGLLAEIRETLIPVIEGTVEEKLRYWREKAVRDFGEERADYQMRTISFIGERMVSAWIATNMRVIQIAKVNPQP